MEVFCHSIRQEWCILDDEFNLIVPVYDFLLREKESGRALNTQKAYCYDLLSLYKFLENFSLDIENLLDGHIGDFRNWILVDEETRKNNQFYLGLNSRILPPTWKRILGTVYKYLEWLNNSGTVKIKVDLSEKYKETIIDNKKVKFSISSKSKWEIKELKRIVEYIPSEKRLMIRSFLGNRDKLIFDFLYLCGHRIGEAFSIKRNLFPLINNEQVCQVVRLPASSSEKLDRQTKSGERDIFIPAELYKRISQYMTFGRYGSKSEYVFVSSRNTGKSKKGDPLSPATFRKKLNKACKKANVKYTPHDLRHTLATDLYEATRDLLGVQRILGHASPVTTQKYVHSPQNKISATASKALNSLYSELMRDV